MLRGWHHAKNGLDIREVCSRVHGDNHVDTVLLASRIVAPKDARGVLDVGHDGVSVCPRLGVLLDFHRDALIQFHHRLMAPARNTCLQTHSFTVIVARICKPLGAARARCSRGSRLLGLMNFEEAFLFFFASHLAFQKHPWCADAGSFGHGRGE